MSVTNTAPLAVYRGEARAFTCVGAMPGGSDGRTFVWRIGTAGSAPTVEVTLSVASETASVITLTGTLSTANTTTLAAGTHAWRVHATSPVEVLADGTMTVSESIGTGGAI